MIDRIIKRAAREIRVRGAIGKIKATRLVHRYVSSCKMQKITPRAVAVAAHDILLFMVVRNERLRLPYVLDYYFSRGVGAAFIIDDRSDDGSLEFLRAYKNVNVFRIDEPFNRKAIWLDVLLNRYARGHWCLIVDADELLAYPHEEVLALRQLCGYLEHHGYNAFDCLLLDMYSDKSVDSVIYESGQDPLAAAPFFDPDGYTQEKADTRKRHFLPDLVYSGPGRVTGGVRRRVFGLERVCVSKFPLVHFMPPMFIGLGTHWVEGVRAPNIRGVLFHCKYFHDFRQRVQAGAGSKTYVNDSYEYKRYLDVLQHERSLSLYYSGSMKYRGVKQLLDLGLMESSEQFDAFVEKVKRTS